MRQRFLCLVLVAHMIASAVPARSEPVRELAAASPWRLDYGAERCELARTFGNGPDAVTLYLRQSAPGHFFDLTVAGSSMGKPRPAFGTKVRYGSLEQREFKDTGWIAAASDGRSALLLGRNTFAEWDKAAEDWVLASPEVLRSITRMEFDVPRADTLALQTGPMDKPMAALAKCMADAVSRWGFDPAQMSALTRPASPINKPANWIASGDYPPALARQGQGALLDLRLVIAETGAVESCAIQNAIGDAAFAALTCEIIARRARFSPAVDASGSPVRSLYFNSAQFQVQ